MQEATKKLEMPIIPRRINHPHSPSFIWWEWEKGQAESSACP